MLKAIVIVLGFAAVAWGAIIMAFCKAAGQADKLPQPKIKHKD